MTAAGGRRDGGVEHRDRLVELASLITSGTSVRITLPFTPALSRIRPRVSASPTMRDGELGVGRAVALADELDRRASGRARGRRRSPACGPAASRRRRGAARRSRCRARAGPRRRSRRAPRAPPRSRAGCRRTCRRCVESSGASMIAARPSTPEIGTPPAIDFATHDQVGLDAEVLHREHAAGAAEAGLHLVGDQHDAVLVADLAQAAAGTRRWPARSRPRPGRAR